MSELEKGQKVLLADLEALVEEVKAGEFGDYSNNKYQTPKVELAERFCGFRDNVINGKYD